MAKVLPVKRPTSLLTVLGTPLVCLLLIAVLAILVFPWAAETLLQSHLTRVTGLSVMIGEVDFSLTRPQFSVKGLQFSNPKDFPDALLAQVGEAKVRYSRRALLRGKLDLRKVKVYFSEFRLVRNEMGNLNLPAIGSSRGETIEEVVLNLGSLTYTDLSSLQPAEEAFDLGLSNSIFRNVKGVSGIVEILNWEILKRTGVEERKAPAPPEIMPTAESPTAGQSAPELAASIPPESGLSESAPSGAPSAQEVGEPS